MIGPPPPKAAVKTPGTVREVNHDPSTGKMRATFHDGRIVEIHGLTVAQHAKLLHAPSLGGAINAIMMRLGGKVVN